MREIKIVNQVINEYNKVRWRCNMTKVKDMSNDDLEQFIEQKLVEILGDPDSGLQLNEEFKIKLEKRLKKPAKRISHHEVLKRFA